MRSRITALACVMTFTIVAASMGHANARCIEGAVGGRCMIGEKPGRMECVGGRFICVRAPVAQPPPYVSKPDVALQLPSCVDTRTEEEIIEAIKDATGEYDVRGQCKNGRAQYGIWRTEARGMDDDAARQRGLDTVNILANGETFGIFLDAKAIRRDAEEEWEKAPHELNEKGEAAEGPIHLTDYDIRFLNNPKRVATRIRGYHSKPVPDIHFTLRITDTLSLEDGKIRCETDVVLDKETGFLHVLTGLALTLNPIPFGALFALESAVIASAKAPERLGDASIGCSVVGFIPAEIMLPNRQKAVMNYSRLVVSNHGITAAGGFSLVAREPRVSIIGPSTIEISSEDQERVTRSFTVVPKDLRPSLTRSW